MTGEYIREYHAFIDEVTRRGRVWEARSEFGPIGYKSSGPEGPTASTFWSNPEGARAFIEVSELDFEKYTLAEIPLETFVERLGTLATSNKPWMPAERVLLNLSDTVASAEADAGQLLADLAGGTFHAVRSYDVGPGETSKAFVAEIRRTCTFYFAGTVDDPRTTQSQKAGVGVLPLWSTEHAARVFIDATLPGTPVGQVPILDFVDQQLPTVLSRRMLLGLDWQMTNHRVEVAPLDVIFRVLGDRPPWDVFLSHAGDDKEAVAYPLYRALRSCGARIWYDAVEMPSVLRPKASNPAAILDILTGALRLTRSMIFVVSRQFLDRPWPRRELQHVIAEWNRTPVFVVWHDLTEVEALRHPGRDSVNALLSLSQETFGSHQQVSEIARAVTEAVPPTPVLRERRYARATCLMGLSSGLVSIVNSAEVDAPPILEQIEYCGRLVPLTTSLTSMSDDFSYDGSGGQNVLDTTLIGDHSVFVLNRAVCSVEDVERGVFVNLAGEGADNPMKVVMVEAAASIGVMNEIIQHELDDLIARLDQPIESRWFALRTKGSEVVVEWQSSPEHDWLRTL